MSHNESCTAYFMYIYTAMYIHIQYIEKYVRIYAVVQSRSKQCNPKRVLFHERRLLTRLVCATIKGTRLITPFLAAASYQTVAMEMAHM